MDLLDDQLAPPARALAEAHVDDCSGCRQFLAALVRKPDDAPDAEGAEPSDAPLSRRLRVGDSVARYELLSVAGVGSHGVVYEARDPELGRRVALKLVHRDGLGSVLGERLRREAQAMAKVRHPNVAQVFDVGEHQGEVFIAMEFLSGETLSDWMSEGVPWRARAEAVCAAGRGLAAAHAAGLVHRDVKPDNIMFSCGEGDASDRRICVTDFGLVASRGGEREYDASALASDFTKTGASVGTPAYMAPEVLGGAVADAKSDQFSFCVTFFEAVWGQRPFQGKTVGELRRAAVEGRLSDVPMKKAERRVLRILRRGLSAEPAERYPSMDVLLTELESALRPSRVWLGVAGGALFAAAAVGALALPSSERDALLCTGAASELESAWGPHKRASLAEALQEAPSRERLLAGLDGYGDRWVAEHTASCRATKVLGHQSAEDMGLRMRCLAKRRTELEAFVRELERTPEASDRALTSIESLGKPSACGDIALLRHQNSEEPIAPEHVQFEGQIATLRAKMRLGLAKDALEFAEELLPKLVDVGNSGLLAEGRASYASLLQAAGKLRDAKNMYDAAISDAVAAKDEKSVAILWIGVARLVGYDMQKPSEAEHLLRAAEVALERLERPRELALRLDEVRAVLASGAGDLAAAEEGFRRVAEGFEEVLGAFHPRTLNALHNLGDVLRRSGKTDAARQLWNDILPAQEERFGRRHSSVASTRMQLGHDAYQRGELQEARLHYEVVLEIRQALLGASAPKVGHAHSTLGLALRALGDSAAAREHHRRALAIYKESLGPEHPNVALALNNLASTAYGEGQMEEAAAMYLEAYELKKRALGERHIDVAAPLFNYASVLRDGEGGCAAAVPLWQEVLEIREAGLPKDHPHMAFPLTSLGDCAEESGDRAHARRMLERALAIRLHHKTDAAITAETQFALARALPKRDATRALALASDALEGLRGRDEQADFAQRIREWIARRQP